MKDIDKIIFDIIGERPTDETMEDIENKIRYTKADLEYWIDIKSKLDIWEGQLYAIKMALERSKSTTTP
jgi:hypothetical protein